MTLLPREIGMLPVTRLSQDKFTMRNICASKKKKQTAHDINMVDRKQSSFFPQSQKVRLCKSYSKQK